MNTAPTGAAGAGDVRDTGPSDSSVLRHRSSPALHDPGLRRPAVAPVFQGTSSTQVHIARSAVSASTEATVVPGRQSRNRSTPVGHTLEHMHDWENALQLAAEQPTQVQQLLQRFDELLSPLWDPDPAVDFEQARTDFRALQQQALAQGHNELAAEALASAVNQALDIFASRSGNITTRALNFALFLLNDCSALDVVLTRDQCAQLLQRLRETQPHSFQHRLPHRCLLDHDMLARAPISDHPAAALRLHRHELSLHWSSLREMALHDPATREHWQRACALLPLLDLRDQEDAVEGLATRLAAEQGRAASAEPSIELLQVLIRAAGKLQSARCRADALLAAARVLSSAGLDQEHAQLALVLSLAMKPSANGLRLQPHDDEALADGSQALRALLERALDHVAQSGPMLLHEIFFLRYMAAIDALTADDADAVHERTHRMAIDSEDGEALVPLARLAARALRPLLHDHERFFARIAALAATLERKLPGAGAGAPHAGVLLTEVRELLDFAQHNLSLDALPMLVPAFREAHARLDALQARTPPGQG